MNSERKIALENFRNSHQVSNLSLDYLNQALTHKSYANELNSGDSVKEHPELHNERLEFLGDAVLGNIIAEALFRAHPAESEGNLTKKKAQAVCEPTLAEIGASLDLGSLLIVGKGELASGGTNRASNIANAVEALLGAVFLDQGFETTKELVLRLWRPYLEEERVAEDSIDYKSDLQEHLMKNLKLRPEYKVVSTDGPDHKRIYEVALFIKDKKQVVARGSSIKRAEQAAARAYIEVNQLKLMGQ